MISLLIVSLTLFLIIIPIRAYRDILSPITLMILVWGFTLALYYLKLIEYYDLTSFTLSIYVTSIVTFVLGSIIFGGNHRQKTETIPLEVLRQTVHIDRFFWAITILFILGILGQILFIQIVEETVGLANVLSDPRILQYHMSEGKLQNLGIINLLSTTNLVNFVLMVIFLMLFRKSHWTKFVVVMLILTTVSVLLRTNRTGIFIPVIWVMIARAYLYGGFWLDRRNISSALVVGGVLVGVFLGLSQWIGKTADANVLRYYWNDSVPFNAGFASLYHYATSAIPAFQVFVERQTELLWGRSTFLPFFRLANLVNADINLVETVRNPVLVPVQTNVYTYLASFYEDYGLFGIVLLPAALGALSTRIYTIWRQNPTLHFLLFSALITTTILWSTFQSIIIFIVIWYYAVIVLVVGIWVTKPKQKPLRNRTTLSHNQPPPALLTPKQK